MARGGGEGEFVKWGRTLTTYFMMGVWVDERDGTGWMGLVGVGCLHRWA